MCAHILVAEDDPRQAELLTFQFERAGHTVTVADNGHSALRAVRARRPDLLVLDLMLPEVAGLEVCASLRAEYDLPVLMLTARSTEDDLLKGFAAGVDDYLTKPYSPRELMARVRALLWRGRHTSAPPDPRLRVGALVVDPARHEVTVHGRAVDCAAAEFRVLAVLAAQPGRVFERRELIQEVFGHEFVTERAIDVHIMNLRKKIERSPRHPEYLLTVYGVGYKMASLPDAP
ncbi:DNA-binding response OmpR family regulator [Crossiella equi]|uniref:DNA-binding response OmpR family regulator n=1 Tax=Crossiella equi TaxID=130796 RepID=A0ABS5A5Y7_9PSEU|nr:response regulator transcription factor [Crossiella equi]MBP2472004.1 DNA-binding response OmpR family regulator [Crossiella equi]